MIQIAPASGRLHRGAQAGADDRRRRVRVVRGGSAGACRSAAAFRQRSVFRRQTGRPGGHQHRVAAVGGQRAPVVAAAARDAGEHGLRILARCQAQHPVVVGGGGVGVHQPVFGVSGGEHQTGQAAAPARVDRHRRHQHRVHPALHPQHPTGGSLGHERGTRVGQHRHRRDRRETGGHHLQVGIVAAHRLGRRDGSVSCGGPCASPDGPGSGRPGPAQPPPLDLLRQSRGPVVGLAQPASARTSATPRPRRHTRPIIGSTLEPGG